MSPCNTDSPLPPPQALAATLLELSVSMTLTLLGISRTWNHAIVVLLHLASFTQCHVLEVPHVDIHVSKPPLLLPLPHFLLLLLVPAVQRWGGAQYLGILFVWIQIIRHYVSGHASRVWYEKY